jgi:hypothetical protein
MEPLPPALRWFRLYSLGLALVYLGCVVASIAMALVDPAALDMSRPEQIVIATLLGALGLVFMLLFAVAPFLPRRRWVWVYDLVLIAVGMTSPCCILASAPLLVLWIRADTRTAFGM